jgi:hypothetical protein
MGLDMDLYISIDGYDIKSPTTISVGERQVTIDNNCYIKKNIAYWRKANAIHRWFINMCAEGIDDCQDVYVSTADLKLLLYTCERVKDNNNLAEELLPTLEGFFFGSVEYDDYYYEMIDYTIKTIKEVLDYYGEGFSFIYRASW